MSDKAVANLPLSLRPLSLWLRTDDPQHPRKYGSSCVILLITALRARIQAQQKSPKTSDNQAYQQDQWNTNKMDGDCHLGLSLHIAVTLTHPPPKRLLNLIAPASFSDSDFGLLTQCSGCRNKLITRINYRHIDSKCPRSFAAITFAFLTKAQ